MNLAGQNADYRFLRRLDHRQSYMYPQHARPFGSSIRHNVPSQQATIPDYRSLNRANLFLMLQHQVFLILRNNQNLHRTDLFLYHVDEEYPDLSVFGHQSITVSCVSVFAPCITGIFLLVESLIVLLSLFIDKFSCYF
jgi:hypothetical protein